MWFMLLEEARISELEITLFLILSIENKNSEMDSGCEINSSDYIFKIVLKVPNDKVGAIIGRKGSVIRQVERDFNVKLKLSKSGNPEDNFSVLTVEGSRDCVAAADVHLRKILAQTSPALLYDMMAPRNLIGMLIGE
uniref:K Homology domain-containing protein n=1 Tax=Romanomermis culicivorax TaxID=13658 RepID=A0A915KVA3_ROMCU